MDLACSRYGLKVEDCPVSVQGMIEKFSDWSTDLINTTRSKTWARAVQLTSIEKTLVVLRGYMGFCLHLMGVSKTTLGLSCYLDPVMFSKFLSYLLGRGAGRDQIIKQISVARKVADFLRAESMFDEDLKRHVAALDQWFQTLITQLHHSLPPPPVPILPKNHVLRAWAEAGLEDCVIQIKEDIRRMGTISFPTAKFLQYRLLVAAVVGVAHPPCRIDVIKHLIHPQYNSLGCQDQDCLHRARKQFCPGNRVTVRGAGVSGDQTPTLSEEEEEELIWEEGGAPSARFASIDPLASGTVTLHIVHGKNDRRSCKSQYNVSFDFPQSDYTFCWLVWARLGNPLMTAQKGTGKLGSNKRMFVTNTGLGFNDVTFCQYWKEAMSDTRALEDFGQIYFPPSKARTSFVEAFTEVGGGAEMDLDADEREGAAAIMGNTEEQWRANYNPSFRQRQVDATMAGFHKFAERQRMKSKSVANMTSKRNRHLVGLPELP